MAFGVASSLKGATAARFSDDETKSVSATAFTESCEFFTLTVEFDDDGQPDGNDDGVVRFTRDGIDYAFRLTATRVFSDDETDEANDTDDGDDEGSDSDTRDGEDGKDDQDSDDESGDDDTNAESDDEADGDDEDGEENDGDGEGKNERDDETNEKLVGILFALDASEGPRPEITTAAVEGGPETNTYDLLGVGDEVTADEIPEPEENRDPPADALYAPRNPGGQRAAISTVTIRFRVCRR